MVPGVSCDEYPSAGLREENAMSNEKKVPKYVAPKAIDLPGRRWPTKAIDKSPRWCAVDLRDGNQALPNPLNPEQKLEYFRLLCGIGFKEIEVACPSASRGDFDFTRRVVAEGLIPEDVMISVLTMCRPREVETTLESLEAVPRAVVHTYLATSDLHTQQVLGRTRAEVIEMAASTARQVRELAAQMPDSDIMLEFSPEEFSDTEPEFAMEICRAVFEAWRSASKERPLIVNLPHTVERRPPNHYADMIEWFCANWAEREKIVVSVHVHNDQGMAIASTELALLAGADRVEGTLFGHGERAGNTDLVVLANNLRSRGVETGLDFSKLPEIVQTVERLTRVPVYCRQPYSGEFVFTAFSATHQDAIRKGMHSLSESPEKFGVGWKVPYLHIDPADLGRRYERLIRITSQSGKGGIAWVLEQDYGLEVPKLMQPELRLAVQRFSDRVEREVTSEEVYQIFQEEFVHPSGRYELIGYWPRPDDDDPTLIHGEIRIRVDGVERRIAAEGNGPISAFVRGLRKVASREFAVEDYHEQAIGKGADAQAVAYVPIRLGSGEVVFGVGTDTNIDQAAVRAIVAGLCRAERSCEDA